MIWLSKYRLNIECYTVVSVIVHFYITCIFRKLLRMNDFIISHAQTRNHSNMNFSVQLLSANIIEQCILPWLTCLIKAACTVKFLFWRIMWLPDQQLPVKHSTQLDNWNIVTTCSNYSNTISPYTVTVTPKMAILGN